MAYFKLFQELWRYAESDRWKVVTFMLLHIFSCVAGLLQPLIFAQILNVLQTHPAHLFHSVLIWVCVWVGLFLWFNLCHRLGRYFEFNVAYNLKRKLLNDYYRIATELPLAWHTDHHSGDTISRINTATTALTDFVQTQYAFITYFMFFWGPILGLAVLSWEISVAALIVAIATIVLINKFDHQLVVLYNEMNELGNRVSAVLYDYIGNIRTVITLRLGHQTGKELDHRLYLGYAPYIRAEAFVNAGKWFMISSCTLLLEAGMILFYVWRQLLHNAPILSGNIAAIYQYLQRMTQTFADVGRDYQRIINWWVDYQAVLPMRSAYTQHNPYFSTSIDGWKNIKIEELNFGYASTKATLTDLSFSFSLGERIALVGESGSGKSTLLALLRGLYEAHGLKLSVDGNHYDNLAPLAAVTTLIPQDPEIFENTIRYNITFGVDHDDRDVREAIRIAQFESVLDRLPHGLDTDVRERGVTLSGGEKQRLALARGIMAARQSSIILMDEPTSSVDAANDAAIYENLFAAFGDRTVISSLHRLNLLARFTRVIVMDSGRIVQTGTFDELKAAEGVFQTLWRKSIHEKE